MRLFNGGGILQITKKQISDRMRHIQGLDSILHAQSSVDVLISMTADMEISRNLFYSEIALETTSTFLYKCLLGDLILSLHIGLPQQLKIISLVHRIPTAIKSVLFD